MNKLRFLGVTSFVSKLTMIGTLYFTVFSVNKVAGFVILAAHGLYELSEVLFERELVKQSQEKVQEFYKQLDNQVNNEDTGGCRGNCGNC